VRVHESHFWKSFAKKELVWPPSSRNLTKIGWNNVTIRLKYEIEARSSQQIKLVSQDEKQRIERASKSSADTQRTNRQSQKIITYQKRRNKKLQKDRSSLDSRNKGRQVRKNNARKATRWNIQEEANQGNERLNVL